MSLGRAWTVRILARQLRRGQVGALVLREIFDQAHAHQTEKWRQAVWREAAERASK